MKSLPLSSFYSSIYFSSNIYDQSGQLIKPFPEAISVLNYLKDEGYILAAASRTKQPTDALQLLDYLDWNKYFSYKEIYPGCKTTHFQK
jgi:magnesium-dependent phosphatase 1